MSERTLTLVGHEPFGVGGAQRRGEVSLPTEKGWAAPAHTGDPPLLCVTKCYHEVLFMKVIIMINII